MRCPPSSALANTQYLPKNPANGGIPAKDNIETKAAVAKAYYGVLVNRERIKIIDANITRVKKLKEDIQALTENGFAELIDKDRVEVTFNNLETEK